MNRRQCGALLFAGLSAIALGSCSDSRNGRDYDIRPDFVPAAGAGPVLSTKTQDFGLPLNMNGYDYLAQLPDSRLVFVRTGSISGGVDALAVDGQGRGTDLNFSSEVLADLSDPYSSKTVVFTQDALLYVTDEWEDESRSAIVSLQDGSKKLATAAQVKAAKDVRVKGPTAYSAGNLNEIAVITDLVSRAPYASYLTKPSEADSSINYIFGAQTRWSAQPVNGASSAWANEDAVIVTGRGGFSIYDASTGKLLSQTGTGENSFCKMVTQPSADTALMSCYTSTSTGSSRDEFRLVSLKAS